MISEQDQQLISELNNLLEQGLSVNKAAKVLGFNQSNSLYQRLYRLGYRIVSKSKLVPIHAKPIDSTQSIA